MNQRKTIELLAPCGGMDSVPAAVHSGADAIYAGTPFFSARANAKNFSREELQEAVSYCHFHGVQVYQAINTVIFNREVDELLKTLQAACETGIDGIIVQDMAVLHLAREYCPELPVHASTQMAVHSAKGVALLEELGMKRVVLARELSLEEIRDIRRQTTAELEVFVHGALCMCVSGQCYMSAFLGGRSANRGNCAQPCRLPFSASPKKQGYNLSLRDLCAVEHIHKLKEIGVDSLKIEGRMKRPEYVGAATAAYRQVIDGKQPDLEALEAVFSRSGFTTGYLRGQRGPHMFGTRTKEDVEQASEKRLKQIRGSYSKPMQRIGLDVVFTMEGNKPCKLDITDQDENTISVEGAVPEIASNRPLQENDIRNSFEKLGGTPFYLHSLGINMNDTFTISASQRNALRRKAVAELEEKRRKIVPKAWVEKPLALPTSIKREGEFFWRAAFRKIEQVPDNWQKYCQEIILPMEELEKQDIHYKERVILYTDRFFFGNEEQSIQQLRRLKEQGYGKLLAQNPAHMKIGQELGFQLHGSWSLNLTNFISIQMLAEQGLTDAMVSPEISSARIGELHPTIPIGGIVYGRMPLMLTRNCPLHKDRPACSRCNGQGALTDRKKKQFPVLCQGRRYAEIFNAEPIYLADRLDEIRALDYGVFLFTLEQKSECETILRNYRNCENSEKSFTRGLYFKNIE